MLDSGCGPASRGYWHLPAGQRFLTDENRTSYFISFGPILSLNDDNSITVNVVLIDCFVSVCGCMDLAVRLCCCYVVSLASL